jgi:hypothetical protein
VHFGTEAFEGCIAVTATLRGENEMLGIGWLTHQPSQPYDDVSTLVFDKSLVIIFPSHVLESV